MFIKKRTPSEPKKVANEAASKLAAELEELLKDVKTFEQKMSTATIG